MTGIVLLLDSEHVVERHLLLELEDSFADGVLDLDNLLVYVFDLSLKLQLNVCLLHGGVLGGLEAPERVLVDLIEGNELMAVVAQDIHQVIICICVLVLALLVMCGVDAASEGGSGLNLALKYLIQ